MHRAILAVALGTLALPAPAGAAVFAGDLDAAFSGDGFLSGSVSAEQNDFPAAAVHALPDGRILVANTTDVLTGAPTNLDFAVQRLLPDGSRDPGFGGGDGIVTTPVGPTTSSDDLLDMAVQPDGKIVVAGRTSPTSGTGGDEFAVVRLEADGDLDPAFDGENADSGDGIVRFEVGSGNSVDRVYAIALQPDGRIVLAGSASVDPSVMGTGFDFAVARLLENGSFDDSFSGDGMDIQTLGTGTVSDAVRAVTLAPGPTPQAPDIFVVGQRNPGIDGADFGRLGRVLAAPFDPLDRSVRGRGHAAVGQVDARRQLDVQVVGWVDADAHAGGPQIEHVPAPRAVGADEVEVPAGDLDALGVLGEAEADERAVHWTQLELVLLADHLGQRAVGRRLARHGAGSHPLEAAVHAQRA